jgi:hypothetical protein
MPKERKRLEEHINAHIRRLRQPSTPDEWDASTLYELNRAIARGSDADIAEYLRRIDPKVLPPSTLQALADRLDPLEKPYIFVGPCAYGAHGLPKGPLLTQIAKQVEALPPWAQQALAEIGARVHRLPKRKPHLQSQTIAKQVKELYRSRLAAGAPERGLMKGVVADIRKRHGVSERTVYDAMDRHGVSVRSIRSGTSKHR